MLRAPGGEYGCWLAAELFGGNMCSCMIRECLFPYSEEKHCFPGAIRYNSCHFSATGHTRALEVLGTREAELGCKSFVLSSKNDTLKIGLSFFIFVERTYYIQLLKYQKYWL